MQQPLLLDICLAVRKRKLANHGTIKGACKEVSLAIAFACVKAGIDVYICSGIYQPAGTEHYWIRFDDHIFDATASQYGGDQEVRVLSASENSPYQELAYIYASADLINELLG